MYYKKIFFIVFLLYSFLAIADQNLDDAMKHVMGSKERLGPELWGRTKC